MTVRPPGERSTSSSYVPSSTLMTCGPEPGAFKMAYPIVWQGEPSVPQPVTSFPKCMET